MIFWRNTTLYGCIRFNVMETCDDNRFFSLRGAFAEWKSELVNLWWMPFTAPLLHNDFLSVLQEMNEPLKFYDFCFVAGTGLFHMDYLELGHQHQSFQVSAPGQIVDFRGHSFWFRDLEFFAMSNGTLSNFGTGTTWASDRSGKSSLFHSSDLAPGDIFLKRSS